MIKLSHDLLQPGSSLLREEVAPAHTSNYYRAEIDGIRAFAVLAVILNHFNSSVLPGGYLGVDIFFVISGYVITSSLERAGNHPSLVALLRNFYEKRVKRLAPALVLYALAASLAICFVNPNPGFHLITGLFSLFGFSNLYLAHMSTDYFAPLAQLNVFTHTWSLAVEEQFYFFFPIIVWLVGFGRNKRYAKRNLGLLVSALVAVSLALFLFLSHSDATSAYYLMPSRFWEIGVGVLGYLGLHGSRKSFQRLGAASPMLVALAILIIMFMPPQFAVLSRVSVVVLTVCLLFGLQRGRFGYELFTNKCVVYIGLISYSLYLWHWGVLAVSKWTFGVNMSTAPLQLMLMFLAASVSYHFVEVPCRKSKWLGSSTLNIVAGNSVLILAALLIASLGRPLKGVLFLSRYPSDQFVYVQKGMECELASDAPSRRPIDCLLAPAPQKIVYVFGNSHASNLIPGIELAARENGFDGVRYLTSAYEKRLGYDWHRHPDISAILSSLNADDLIVWSHSTVDASNKRLSSSVASRLRYLVEVSSSRNVPVLIVDDIPGFGGDDNFYPAFAFYGQGPSVSRGQALVNRAYHTGLLMRFVNASEKIFYYDPLPDLCSADTCSAVINGIPVYADGSPHFSRKGALILSAPLSGQLHEILDSSFK